MTDTTADVAALCRAIDAGDDACLPVLADALEEAGDARAGGLRDIFEDGQTPEALDFGERGRGWGWARAGVFGIGRKAFARLPRREAMGSLDSWPYPRTGYPTRSAAFLALAEALIVR